MKALEISISDNNATLSKRCLWAQTSYQRLVGLLMHKSLEASESLLIEPCKQVHTFFMRFPIDVVFLDSSNTVLKIQEMKPWMLSSLIWKASKVLELPLGHCKAVGLKPGQTLEIKEAERSHA